DRKVVLLKTDDIDWIASAHNHIVLHVGQRTHLIRGSLNSIEARLPPDKFIRISRSKIVQIDRIKELDRLGSGDCFLSLIDGTRLLLSRRYRSLFQKMGLM